MKGPVYLAGGFGPHNWQARVIAQYPDLKFYNPRDDQPQGCVTEEEYTKWDLDAIDKSNTVFAFMEESNPGGEGMCLEVGYAHGQGKRVIYVGHARGKRDRYFGMVRAVADQHFNTLVAAFSGLKREEHK